MAKIVYQAGNYLVKRTAKPKNRPYLVIHIKAHLHTHLRTEKEARDLVNFARHNHIPQGAKADYLQSLLRVTTSERQRQRIAKLIAIKLSTPPRYKNLTGGGEMAKNRHRRAK